MIHPYLYPLPLRRREGVKKSGRSVRQEHLQSFRNAVIWKVKVTRLCN